MIRVLRESTAMWSQHLVEVSPRDDTGDPGQLEGINWMRLLKLVHLHSLDASIREDEDLHPCIRFGLEKHTLRV